jgi:hypothetical protein
LASSPKSNSDFRRRWSRIVRSNKKENFARVAAVSPAGAHFRWSFSHPERQCALRPLNLNKLMDTGGDHSRNRWQTSGTFQNELVRMTALDSRHAQPSHTKPSTAQQNRKIEPFWPNPQDARHGVCVQIRSNRSLRRPITTRGIECKPAEATHKLPYWETCELDPDIWDNL